MSDPGADDRPDEARLQALTDFAKRAAHPSITEIVDRSAVEVVDALDRAGIPFLVLKGPALSRYLYRPDERRPYIDVDLLVPPTLRAEAGRVLLALGYENSTEQTGVDEFTGALHAETWQSQTWMPVDLHWRLAGCEAPAEGVWERLWATRQSIELAGRAAYVPGPDGLALHLATHAAQHGPEDVKAIGDLRRGLARWPLGQWRAAAELAAAAGAMGAFAAGLRLCPEGEELAATLRLPETAELSWMIRNRRIRPRGTFHLDALRRAQRRRDLITVVRRSLFPSSTWIRREYAWASRGRTALVAAYGRHLLRTPAWAVRAWKYRRRAQRAGGTSHV